MPTYLVSYTLEENAEIILLILTEPRNSDWWRLVHQQCANRDQDRDIRCVATQLVVLHASCHGRVRKTQDNLAAEAWGRVGPLRPQALDEYSRIGWERAVAGHRSDQHARAGDTGTSHYYFC
jgi:hypothetical protein